MKLLKQLALVSAMATATTGAFALEQLDDAALANTTGQDGIAISIQNPDGIKISQVLIHDNDGLVTTDANGATTAGNSGALVIGDADLATPGLTISGGTIKVDVNTDGGNGTDGAFLDAAVSLPSTTKVSMEGIYLGDSNDTKTGPYTGANQRGLEDTDTPQKILGALGLELTNMKANLQLGSQPQGAMAKIDATLTGGLVLNNLEIVDSNGFQGNAAPKQGALFIGEARLTDATGPDLKLKQTIDIDSDTGITIKMADTGGFYGYLTDVAGSNGDAGTAVNAQGVASYADVNKNILPIKPIGDVEIVGLNMGESIISISGINSGIN